MGLKVITGAAVSMLLAGAAQAGDVVVELTGVQARQGELLTSLQTESQFMKPAAAYTARLSPKAGTVIVTFKDVAPGEYAFGALHDEDGDRQLKMAETGMPVEGVASSRGEELRGPPTFADVKVTVPAQGLRLKAPMMYFDGRYPGQPAS